MILTRTARISFLLIGLGVLAASRATAGFGKMCHGFAGIQCSNSGHTCYDDPRDDCDVQHGGADCAGLCFPSCNESWFCTEIWQPICIAQRSSSLNYKTDYESWTYKNAGNVCDFFRKSCASNLKTVFIANNECPPETDCKGMNTENAEPLDCRNNRNFTCTKEFRPVIGHHRGPGGQCKQFSNLCMFKSFACEQQSFGNSWMLVKPIGHPAKPEATTSPPIDVYGAPNKMEPTVSDPLRPNAQGSSGGFGVVGWALIGTGIVVIFAAIGAFLIRQRKTGTGRLHPRVSQVPILEHTEVKFDVIEQDERGLPVIR